MKIYAVNSGVYSDYQIDALFSTEKKAQEFMDCVKYNAFNDIEVFEIDPPITDKLNRGYSVWDVLMLINGNTEKVARSENYKYDVLTAPRHRIWERTKAQAYHGKNTPNVLQSSVWAKTEKQALKIVNEKRIRMIESGEWREEPNEHD